MKTKKKIIAFLSVFMLICSMHAVSGHRLSFRCGGREIKPDTEGKLLHTFRLLCRKISDIRGEYTLGGVINVINRAKPSENVKDIRFLFCKRGDEFFYRLGETVMLNQQGVYLYIDRRSRSIILSPQKQVLYDTGLKQFADIGATIKSENYRVTSNLSGNEETITLLNEQHITCKQYSLTFDRRSLKISSLYLRLTDIGHPLSKDKEKKVNVRITRWDSTADLGRFLSKNSVITNINGRWRTTGEFKNYQLTSM